MGKQLSQGEIDALLNSLRQAQDDTPGPRTGTGAAPETRPVWDQLGEELATALAECLTRGWRRRVPVMSVVRGDVLPPGFRPDAPSRVERLGSPLGQRVWFFWDAAGPAGQAAADAFLAELEALLPATWTHQTMPGHNPFPADGLLLPFRGVTAGENIPLTIGLEARQIQRLQDRLTHAAAAPDRALSTGAQHPALTVDPTGLVRVGDLEVEVSVYVGGGMYPLATLASLRPGAVLPLLTEVGEPAVIAIQGRVIALGEVMVTRDDTLAVRLTKLLLGEEGRLTSPEWLEQARRQPPTGDPTPPPTLPTG